MKKFLFSPWRDQSVPFHIYSLRTKGILKIFSPMFPHLRLVKTGVLVRFK